MINSAKPVIENLLILTTITLSRFIMFHIVTTQPIEFKWFTFSNLIIPAKFES